MRVGASPHQPPHVYIYMYGEIVRALWCPFVGRMQYAPTLTVDCMGSFCQLPDLDTPQDVPDKGTNVVFGLCRWVICWGHPGPAVPDCGAYAVAPLP